MSLCEFKKINLPDDKFCLIEPSAGLVLDINKRLKLFTDEEGKLITYHYSGVYILACLHYSDGKPVVVDIADSLGFTNYSLRFIFEQLHEEDFKQLVNEFIYSSNRETIENWFTKIDEECLITKKVKDTEKNS